MKKNDFRYHRRGKQVHDLKKDDFTLLQPITQQGAKTDRALLLLHGFSSSPAIFRKIIPQLNAYDALYCPVLTGHGGSIEDFARTTGADWLQSAQQASEELFQTYDKVDVLGLSLGGLLACKLSEHFAFNHLFLLAPALKLTMNVHAKLKLAHFLKQLGFKELRNAGGNIINEDDAEISYKRLPLNAIIEMFQLVINHQWVPPSCPVDLFLGSHDNVVSSPEVEVLFRELTNVSIHWLEHSAHLLPLDNDIQQIIDCINNS